MKEKRKTKVFWTHQEITKIANAAERIIKANPTVRGIYDPIKQAQTEALDASRQRTINTTAANLILSRLKHRGIILKRSNVPVIRNKSRIVPVAHESVTSAQVATVGDKAAFTAIGQMVGRHLAVNKSSMEEFILGLVQAIK